MPSLTSSPNPTTTITPTFSTPMLTVRGYDKSHRLFREMVSKSYLNKKDSDLATEIAQSAGLTAQVDQTQTVYDHIFQDNLSDLSFLMRRAWRIGYECYLDDGTLYFCRPPSSPAELTLEWGKDLVSFHPRLSLAEQVDEVIVKGWNPESQEAIALVYNKDLLKAAEALHKSQSALTYAVQKLEDQVGVPLFDRAGYRPALSEAGRALLPYATRVLPAASIATATSAAPTSSCSAHCSSASRWSRRRRWKRSGASIRHSSTPASI